MSRFRLERAGNSTTGLEELLNDIFQPCHFYVACGGTWVTQTSVDLPWETYQERLVDPRHARERRAFRAWGLFAEEERHNASWPIVGIKWDLERRELHVVRALLSHVWESHDA